MNAPSHIKQDNGVVSPSVIETAPNSCPCTKCKSTNTYSGINYKIRRSRYIKQYVGIYLDCFNSFKVIK